MKSFKQVEQELKNLQLKPYKLIDIVKIILSCEQMHEEKLFEACPLSSKKEFWKDQMNAKDFPALKSFEYYFPRGLLDLWVQITYQRVIKLKKILEHLRRKDYKGDKVYFNTALAGAIDIAVRPGGKGFIWDGFRRSIIAIINGVRYPSFVMTKHPESYTDERCEQEEAHWFKVRNGDSESMPKEELYKAGIVYKDKSSIKVLNVLKKMKADVIGTNPGAGNPELGAFSTFQDFILKSKLDPDYLVQASHKQQQAWSNDTALTGYLTCGLAQFLEALEMEDEEVDEQGREYGNFGIYTKHPNDSGTCAVGQGLKVFAKSHKQTDLTVNRLSGFPTESVAYFIGSKVMKMKRDCLLILAKRLGFDIKDADTINYLALQSEQNK